MRITFSDEYRRTVTSTVASHQTADSADAALSLVKKSTNGLTLQVPVPTSMSHIWMKKHKQ